MKDLEINYEKEYQAYLDECFESNVEPKSFEIFKENLDRGTLENIWPN